MKAETFPNPFNGASVAGATSKPKALSFVSAADLAASPPVVPAVLLEGVLYRGGTMMFSGPSKAHKTYTMLAFGVAVATGREFLGMRTTPGVVLYLNLELPDFGIEERLAGICSAMNVERPANLLIANLRGKRITLADLSVELPALIKQHNAVLVIIDPHYKISAVSGFEENSNDSQGELLSALETMCSGNGAALCIAHHFSKGDASAKNAIDRASGGGVMARWPDVIATLTEHEEDDAMTINLFLRLFAPVPPFVVRWAHPVWARDGALDPANLKKSGGRPAKHSPDKVLESLPAGQWVSSAEWNRLAGDVPQSSFRDIRDKLKASGKVELSSGQYRRKAA